MNNEYYEKIYTNYIEPLYGNKRNKNIDSQLLNDNHIFHSYSIHDRLDLTYLDVFSIDPEGCLDADDAFSIFIDDNLILLFIHIADPTEYIELNSKLWLDIEERILTKYPSNRPPIHLMPYEIMGKSSLIENEYGNIKNAISIMVEINKFSFLPENNIQLLFSKIKVKKENAYSYLQASENIYNIKCFKLSLLISEALIIQRSNKTISVKLNDLDHSIISYHNKIPFLYNDSNLEKKIKQMIAEFAILSNSFIGTYLNIHFNGKAIFRSCDSSSLHLNTKYPISSENLLHEIIVNGIQASYIEKVAPHDLIGVEEYTHFTSPIRRASDCICHYLLKYLYLKNVNKNNNINLNHKFFNNNEINEIEQHFEMDELIDEKKSYNLKIPFTLENLQNLSNKCLIETKKFKKIQYKDNKFRYIQIMNLMLLNLDTLNLKFYLTSYKKPFLNLIICNINNFNIYLSYTLKISALDINYNHLINKNIYYEIEISNVNCLGKYDQGSIPELDNYIINYIFSLS